MFKKPKVYEIGDLVKIIYIGKINILSDQQYLIIDSEYVSDNCNLLKYNKYTLLNTIDYTLYNDIKVWEHGGGFQYNLELQYHTCYTYLLGVYYRYKRCFCR